LYSLVDKPARKGCYQQIETLEAADRKINPRGKQKQLTKTQQINESISFLYRRQIIKEVVVTNKQLEEQRVELTYWIHFLQHLKDKEHQTGFLEETNEEVLFYSPYTQQENTTKFHTLEQFLAVRRNP